MFSVAFLIWATLLNASATPFETSYLHLNVPENWACERQDSNWICQPKDAESAHTASLVLSAKQAGPEDTLSSLLNQLKTPRTINVDPRTVVTSQYKWSQELNLAGHPWVEALHLNREVNGFFSYYLATVTDQLVILVNFTYQETTASKYQPVLEEIRRSTRLNTISPPRPQIDTTEQPAVPGAQTQPTAISSPSPESLTGISPGSKNLLFLLGVGALGLVLFGLLKRK